MVLSKVGLVLAVLYVAFAVMINITDRTSTTGGWISLQGIASYVVTLPVSAPFELAGAKLDYRKNIDMAIAIGGCAMLIYFIGAGIGWVFGAISRNS